MASNKLSIHVEGGDIFYENHNTGESFYNFLIAQQNEQAADIPKKFSYRNSFELYISSFLSAFSIDDVEKYDLFTHENFKYLFIVLMIMLRPMVVIKEKINIPLK